MQQYHEDEYLAISGINHYAFCPRQYALIHIEHQWIENSLTAIGRVMHKKVHDSAIAEKRNDIITINALKVSSTRLGISGECDSVQFFRDERGVYLPKYKGKFIPYPVEYKKGKSKLDNCDRLQVLAQAVCLEEMLNCTIETGALFYGEPRKREVVEFTRELRDELEYVVLAMHQLHINVHTPKAKFGSHCNQCSLHDICMPELTKTKQSVRQYLQGGLD
ncbi:MAG: CRISPR-associated protein Cas4 [Clostridiales bacterium]|jgi:CRISPR-associated exonuclease Cas4|nr:CRISPR-associated protein Cas4 [Clostridiales bacterium]